MCDNYSVTSKRCVIIIRIAVVAKQSRNLTGALLCYGTVFMIGAQTIINIGMCLMLLPCIGITLPFMSAGGSSNLCIYIAEVFFVEKYTPAVNLFDIKHYFAVQIPIAYCIIINYIYYHGGSFETLYFIF